MYQYAAILPPFTNREDYLLTIGVYDDDTLEPIDMSGITLANTGADFTAASWTVTDGAIVTSSATSITIPMFPVTGDNNLTVLTLTVDAGLAIAAGDPIAIADAATGANVLNGYVTSYAAASGVLTVQIGWTFQFEIRRGGPRNQGSGYDTWFDWGIPDDLAPLLTASFSNGYLSLVEANIVQILIPESVIKTLGATGIFTAAPGDAPGTYKAAMTGTDGVNTRQLLTASQPFYYGGVTN